MTERTYPTDRLIQGQVYYHGLLISGGLNDNFAHIFTMGADAILPVTLIRQKEMGLFTPDVV